MKQNLYYKTGEYMIGNVDFADRWDDLHALIDYDGDANVLDVGCAEGLISIKLAHRFKHVDAFDIEPFRIQKALENMGKITNIDFRVGNFMTYDYKHYDQVFCLGVYHKIKYNTRERALATMFERCKNTLYLRVPVIDDSVTRNVGVTAREVLRISNNNGFDLVTRTEQRPLHGTIFKFKRR